MSESLKRGWEVIDFYKFSFMGIFSKIELDYYQQSYGNISFQVWNHKLWGFSVNMVTRYFEERNLNSWIRYNWKTNSLEGQEHRVNTKFYGGPLELNVRRDIIWEDHCKTDQDILNINKIMKD